MNHSPFRSRILALLAVALAWVPSPLFAQTTDPALLKARKWDQSMVLGPGGYKGGDKGIYSSSKTKHVVAPETLLTSANFEGDRWAEWTIDGALLRDVRLGVELHSRVEAKDTAFENCKFYKNGGWFNSWWGTKWRFQNCVFTKDFMRESLPINDYSVRATECTFVGIKLPKLGLKNPEKDDPGKYLREEDNMQFVRCRFISCQVPETLLASTVDCVFEGCQFEKSNFAWEKAKTPIKVTAYVTGPRVPPSYTVGMLEVIYVAAQPSQLAGAKLAVTQAGGRLIFPWAQKVTQFVEMGSVDKKASEIPALGGGTASPVASTPAVSTTPAASSPSMFGTPVVPAGSGLSAGAPVPVTPSTPKAPVTTAANTRPITGPNGFLNIPGGDPEPARGSMPAASATAAATAPPLVAAGPAIKEVRSFADILAVVPLEIALISAGRVNPAALESANSAIDLASAGKPLLMRVNMEELSGYRQDGYSFALTSQGVPVRVRGEAATARIKGLFHADKAAALSRLSKGSQVTVRGVISKAELVVMDRGVIFLVTVADATIQ